jgi:CubicO group peptidase (beta-lactamase class C family)
LKSHLLVLSCASLFLNSAAAFAAPSSVADYIGAVENPQLPDRNGYDSLTLQQLMQRAHVPAVSIAVIRNFKIHWAKSYGVADLQTGAPADTETLFQAASISKPVTAMALLKAAQDGKLSIDDDVNTLLRTWKLPDGPLTKDRPVTLRMLTSHTSGLGDGFGFPGYEPSAARPTTIQILNGHQPSNVGAVTMERLPLQAMKYSGGGWIIVQLALTEVLGRPFPDILQDYVLGPIGMTNSTFQQPLSPARDRNAARGHDEQGKAMGAKWHVYPELSAAGLWTTPTDLAKLVIEVQTSVHGKSNRVLSRSTVQEMLSPVGIGDFAVGFGLEKRGQGWYFQHSGGNWGFISLLVAHKLKGYGLVVMTNSFGGGALTEEIKERVERAYGWDSLDKAVSD